MVDKKQSVLITYMPNTLPIIMDSIKPQIKKAKAI